MMYAMQEETARGPFVPTKVIVLAELSIREKEQYYQLMVANNCKFHKDGEGRFVGNVRLLSPNVRKIEHELKKKDSSNYSLTFQERLTRLKQEGFINVQIIAPEQIEYNGYPRFTALIAYNGDTVRPRPRPLAWVMKIVEDIYDYRFSHEKNDVQREDDSPSFDLMLLIFPVFVVRRLGTNCGLKSLVDQTCWDLLYNTHVYRRDYLELEVFARFLQEFYDHDDLLFFLYVRSVIAKVLHLSFKSRWAKSDGPGRQPRSLWMSYRESAHVARIVFGSENEDMLRDFMYLITPQMVGQKTATSDSRRIDITEYLHLSVVGYHQSQSRAKGHIAGGGQRMLVPIPGQLTPPIPAPMPDTLAGDVIGHDDGMHEHYEEEGDDDGRGGGEYDDDDAYHGGSAHQHHHPHQQYHEGTDQDHYDPNNEEYRAVREAEQTAMYELESEQQQHGGPGQGQGQGQGQRHWDRRNEHARGGYGVDLQGIAASPIPHNDSSPFPYDYGESKDPQQQQSGNHNHDPLNASQESGLLGEHISLPVTNTVSSHTDQGAAPIRAGVAGAGAVASDSGGNNQGPSNGGAVGQEEEEEEVNEFEQLQSDRESAFVRALMEPLEAHDPPVLPPEYINYIASDIAERFNQTVTLFLSDKNITDIESLDAFLQGFLQLEQLRVDFEATRDELVQHFLSEYLSEQQQQT